MADLRQRMSDRLLRSGVELSVDRYEMAERARADRAPVDAFSDESSVLLLTGWASRFNLWMARQIRPRVHRQW